MRCRSSSCTISSTDVDSTTLWTETLKNNPACWLCETNLAVPLVARGTPDDLSRAIDHLRAAVRLHPNAPESHDGLGVALQKVAAVDQQDLAKIARRRRAVQRRLEFRADLVESLSAFLERCLAVTLVALAQ